MRYLWVAAISAGIAAGPVAAAPAEPKTANDVPMPKVMAPPPPTYYPAAPPPPPVPKGLPRPAWPNASPATWVTMADYPAAALRSEISGVSRFQATIDTTGRVSDCAIVESSGSAILDQAACRAVMARAQFVPALDRRGKPTTGTYQNAIRWVIPREVPRIGPTPGETVMSMTVNEDGTVSDCLIEKVAEGIAVNPAGPQVCAPRKMLPYRDGAGNPVKRRVVTTFRVDVLPVD